jgi:hypothetical protein
LTLLEIGHDVLLASLNVATYDGDGRSGIAPLHRAQKP